MQGLLYLAFNSNSLSTHLFITPPKQVCFYLVAVYTLHNERNDFVSYSEILQHWVHCCVCREVGEQFNILTINICIILKYLLSRACLKHMVVGRHQLCCTQFKLQFAQGESAHLSHKVFKLFFFFPCFINCRNVHLKPVLDFQPAFYAVYYSGTLLWKIKLNVILKTNI